MNKCTDCDENLIWGGDHSYEDYSIEGEGIVSNYSCFNKNCEVETLIIYRNIWNQLENI